MLGLSKQQAEYVALYFCISQRKQNPLGEYLIISPSPKFMVDAIQSLLFTSCYDDRRTLLSEANPSIRNTISFLLRGLTHKQLILSVLYILSSSSTLYFLLTRCCPKNKIKQSVNKLIPPSHYCTSEKASIMKFCLINHLTNRICFAFSTNSKCQLK